ncbi:DUF92 domain-containing protein [Adhaeribacter pallidiroseus]|uniref:Putative membrane protein n=1 Tax=Adhaeribacter pallidiroseus TaxID=2072847 RepID=A0A369QB32_9BACT|nr:DUF92 domain-containing protein [Adhaeribacter pallidiroseus]RDC62133.1 putative membrane protein [Adhaeribacter pallidiroseus]
MYSSVAACSPNIWFVLAFLGLGMYLSVAVQKLTVAGAITGGTLGFAIFLGAGYAGLVMLGVFFGLGSAATSWKLKYKQSQGLAELNKGRRTAGQAFANAGVAAITGLLAWLFPANAPVYQVMLAASFAAATADTLSSELGNVYGRRFYHVLTGQKATRGLNGAISLQGTGFGILGSSIIGFLYGIGFGWSYQVLSIVLAGTIGNFFDSILGATLENRGYLSNNAVNFLNTLVGALAGGAFISFVKI